MSTLFSVNTFFLFDLYFILHLQIQQLFLLQYLLLHLLFLHQE